MVVTRRACGHVGRRVAVLGLLLLLPACAGRDEERSTPGFSGDTITVGVLTPLGDEVAVIGVPLAAGLRTYFDSQNARGGVRGRVLCEDQTDGERAESSGGRRQDRTADPLLVREVLYR